MGGLRPWMHKHQRVCTETMLDQKLCRLAILPLGLSLVFGTTALYAQSEPANVLTYHNDLAGTGQNLNETILTPATVNSNTFGRLFSRPVDGYVFPIPLYLSGVEIPGKGTHNVIFVATAHDTVYAFDADSNRGENAAPLWQVSFINSVAGITTIPTSVFGFSDPPEIGIMGTPVIDAASGTLYVVAKIRDASAAPVRYFARLYALDVATGTTKFGSPVDIQGSAPGTGTGSVSGVLSFNPLYEANRCALLLLNGVIYLTFASHNDSGPYHGCIVGYDAQTLDQVSFFYTTPNGSQGGIWMSAGAPTADEDGNIYCVTGNGAFDLNNGGVDFGNSFLKLGIGATNLFVVDYFAPYNAVALNSGDQDLGTCAPLLLPDGAGSPAHPHLLVAGSKTGVMYLIDRDNMGHFNAFNNSQIVQQFQLGPLWNTLAYFKNFIYVCPANNYLSAYSVTNAHMSTTPVMRSSYRFAANGASPSISANGTNNAIVWVVEKDASFSGRGPAVLRAYDAMNLTNQLYSSNDAGTRDQIQIAREFQVPVVANGKVYVATQTGLSVFGTFASVQPRLYISPNLGISLEGHIGDSYGIQYSTNLVDWTELMTVTPFTSPQTLEDLPTSQDPQGFYRAVLKP